MKKNLLLQKNDFCERYMFINFNEKQSLEFNPTIFFFLKYVLKLHELFFHVQYIHVYLIVCINSIGTKSKSI